MPLISIWVPYGEEDEAKKKMPKLQEMFGEGNVHYDPDGP